MIIAQVILITPIVAALSCQILETCMKITVLLHSLCVPNRRSIQLYGDARYSLLTVVLAGFGRAVSEVGAVIWLAGILLT